MVKRDPTGPRRRGRRGDRRLKGASGRTSSHRTLDELLLAVERREILAALARAAGQRTKAAELLGVSRSRLYRRIEALAISLDADHPNGHA